MPRKYFLFLLAACAGGGGGPRERPPVEVAVKPATKEPIRETREFIGTLNSRRAVLLQSQVTGYISAIPVKAGDKVQKDQALVVIDSSREQANLNSLIALKQARSANLDYSTQQAKRSQELVGTGVVSQQAAEQANAQARSAEADAAGIEAQIRAQQTQLAYYRITAPTAGVVSDIPVKVGDFVTPGARLTTVVQDAALELNVSVPLELAPKLSASSQVELLDDEGNVKVLAPVSFISPNVDPETQLVLLKSVFENKDEMRFAQYIRTRVVLGSHEGVRVPSTAIQRLAGAPFVYIAEEKDGKTVARQKAVTLGDLDDNAYEIKKGVEASERLVTTNVEKLFDGAAIKI